MKSFKILICGLLFPSLLLYCFDSQAQCFTHYSLTPNGNVCGASATVTLAGSQSGVTYKLMINGSYVGSPVIGNGSALNLGTVNNTQTGTYLAFASQTGTSCNGPEVVASNQVTFVPSPSGTVSASNSVICGGNAVTLTYNPNVPGVYNYQWFLNGSTAISGANSQTYAATSAGSYTVLVNNPCGGFMSSAIVLTSSPAMGILSPISGNPVVAAGVATSTYTASATNASSYVWSLSTPSAGTIMGSAGTATVNWDTSFSGVVTVSVTAYGCSGTGVTNAFAVAYNSNNSNYNFITETNLRVPGITSAAAISGVPSDQKNINYTYFDGLGRPVQKVMQNASPTSKDIIQPIAYDNLGRESMKYLPYSTGAGTSGSYRFSALKGNAGYTSSDQYLFYQQSNQGYNTTTAPYTKTVYEQSPLARPIEEGLAGTAWQPGTGHTTRLDYLFNNNLIWANDPLNSRQAALYTATINSDGSRTLSRLNNTATYNDNELQISVVKDPNWTSGRAGTTEQYQDKFGRTVLKRSYFLSGTTLKALSTYYVYDANGDLAFVLPPGASPDLNVLITPDVLNNYCYQYQFDERNRITGKKLPGSDIIYLVYNQSDQLVASQDGNQRTRAEWQIVKYDAAGRVIITGLWNNSGVTISPTDLKSNIESAPQWDVRDATSTLTGYAISSYPQALNTLLSIKYYDDYAIPNIPGYSATQTSKMTEGLLTATRTAVIKPDNTMLEMLWTVNYYDDLGRVKVAFKQHYLKGIVNVNNYDQVVNTYNFNSAVTTVTRKHYINSTTNTLVLNLTVANRIIYDQAGRKIKNWEQLTNGSNSIDTRVLISKIDYNEINQQLAKHLHSVDSAHFYQDINYAYNEQGWLTRSTAPLFTMQLKYNDGTTPRYNGDIADQVWTGPAGGTHTYTYTYDEVNRLTSGVSDAGYSETGPGGKIDYDLMGNVAHLTRANPNTGTVSYTLNYTGNLLNSVTNLTGTDTYQYDSNGNTKHNARDGSGTVYNILNLPEVVTVTNGTVKYTYDASGRKLSKLSTINSMPNLTEYIDGIEYDQGTLRFIITEEGRAIASGATNNYEYHMEDHLGNVRVAFDTHLTTPTTVQQNDYYPFGIAINIGSTPSQKNEYLFNHKELQEETGLYDYGARSYDPIVARWLTADPLTEKFSSVSPYNYCLNNPITTTDEDGMAAKWNGMYGDKSGYYDDKTGQTVGWDDVQKENSIGDYANNLTVMLFPSDFAYANGMEDFGHALNTALQSAKGISSSNIRILQVNNMQDAVDQVRQIGALINRLFIFSHGYGKDISEARFNIGLSRVTVDNVNSGSVGQGLNELAAALAPNAEIIIMSCHAGANHNGGVRLLSLLAKKMNATVFGNKSWTMMTNGMFEDLFNDGFFSGYSGMYYPKADGVPEAHKKEAAEYTKAVANEGKWTKVSPDGTRVTIINVYFDSHAQIHYDIAQ